MTMQQMLAPMLFRLNGIILGILCVVFGAAFSASPAYDFIKRMEDRNFIPPEQKADLDTLLASTDQAKIRAAVDSLLARDDVARVQVMRGEHDWPDMNITIGKDKKLGKIASSVYFNENDTRVYISYFHPKDAAPKTIWDELRAMQPVGSFMLGLIMIGCGFVVMFTKQQPEQPAAAVLPPKPWTTPTPVQPETKQPETQESEPKYQGLRLV